MKRAVIIGIALVAAVFGFKTGGWGGITVSGFLPELSNLNTRLTEINRDLGATDNIEFSAPLFMIGGHGCGQIGPVTIGGGGAGFGVREKTDTLSARIRYGMGYGEIGFQVEPLRWLWIRPCLSIGGSGFDIELDEWRGEFGEIPEDTLYVPYHYLASAWSFNVGAALVLEFNLPITKSGFVGLEIKGGYLYPLYTSDWRDQDGLTVKEVEGFGIYGPYVQVAVNFGRSGELDLSWETEDDWEDY